MNALKNIIICVCVALGLAFMAGVPVLDLFSAFGVSSAAPKRQVRAYNAPKAKALLRDTAEYAPPQTASAEQSEGTELKVFDSDPNSQDAFSNQGIAINAATASRDILQNAPTAAAVQNIMQKKDKSFQPDVILSHQAGSGNSSVQAGGGDTAAIKMFSSDRSPGAYQASGFAVDKQNTSAEMFQRFDGSAESAGMVAGAGAGIGGGAGAGAGEGVGAFDGGGAAGAAFDGGAGGDIGGGAAGAAFAGGAGGDIGGGAAGAAFAGGGGGGGGGGFGGGNFGGGDSAAFDMNNPNTVAAMVANAPPQSAAVEAVMQQFDSPDKVSGVKDLNMDKVQPTLTKIEGVQADFDKSEEDKKITAAEKAKKDEADSEAAAKVAEAKKPKGRAYYEKQDRFYGDENEELNYDKSVQFDGFKL